MASHRAFYVLQLGEARPGSNISGGDGGLMIEWSETCDGYATSQRIVTRLWNEGGEDIVSDLRSSAFESRDLARFDFRLTNRTQGQVTEQLSGVAEKPDAKDASEAGHVRYRRPDGQEGPLPKSVIFPTEHAFALIEAAKTGERHLERLVFEGGDMDEVYSVVSLVGGKSPKDAERPEELKGLDAWPVVISYYAPEAEEALPEYEIRFRLFSNGISDSLVMDYGDFSLRGRLDRLELLSAPSC
jgi:hypothetical protein